MELFYIDDEIVDRLSTAVHSSVLSGISKTYSELAMSSFNSVGASAVIPKVYYQVSGERDCSRRRDVPKCRVVRLAGRRKRTT